jgi:hypothetical protein
MKVDQRSALCIRRTVIGTDEASCGRGERFPLEVISEM